MQKDDRQEYTMFGGLLLAWIIIMIFFPPLAVILGLILIVAKIIAAIKG